MEIVILGTSAGVPTKNRGFASIFIRRYSDHFLFDIGEGTQRQLMKAGIRLGRNLKIFISHMHGDHVVGLLGLLQTLTLLRRRWPIEIFGPRGLKDFVLKNMEMLNINPTFPISLWTLREGVVCEEKEYYVEAIRANHGMESYSFALVEKERPGRFNAELAKQMGIPKQLWSKIKRGERVVINGKEIDPSQFVGPPLRGRKIVYSGDTRFSEKLIELARGADVLIHEATYISVDSDRAEKNFHSTAKEAATVAKRGGVALLVIFHYSPRYNTPDPLLKEAREVFPLTIAADDLLRIEVPHRGFLKSEAQ